MKPKPRAALSSSAEDLLKNRALAWVRLEAALRVATAQASGQQASGQASGALAEVLRQSPDLMRLVAPHHSVGARGVEGSGADAEVVAAEFAADSVARGALAACEAFLSDPLFGQPLNKDAAVFRAAADQYRAALAARANPQAQPQRVQPQGAQGQARGEARGGPPPVPGQPLEAASIAGGGRGKKKKKNKKPARGDARAPN